jgi:hypothetical protein
MKDSCLYSCAAPAKAAVVFDFHQSQILIIVIVWQDMKRLRMPRS